MTLVTIAILALTTKPEASKDLIDMTLLQVETKLGQPMYKEIKDDKASYVYNWPGRTLFLEFKDKDCVLIAEFRHPYREDHLVGDPDAIRQSDRYVAENKHIQERYEVGRNYAQAGR